MDFRLLGPFEAAEESEPLALGPRKQRALLARLLLDAGRTVAVERLVDDLWGDDVPETAVKMIQIYVSGLRKAVSPERLRTRAPGYGLELAAADTCDLHRFEALTAAGRAALATGDAAGAAEQLRAALALWRGPALAEFSAESFARPEADRLAELQLTATEDRIEAELRLGREADVTPEIETLTARHPLRERLRGQLMLALYRAGRQGEAIAAYHAFRATLDEELGIGPSPRLRELEQAILTQDPALDVRPLAASSDAPVGTPPGRADELAALHDALDAAGRGARRLVLITGEPGIGKTTLVDALLATAPDALVIRGDCVAQHGDAEAYLPLLDGLGRAARDEPQIASVLAERAPSWLAELPWIGAETPAERIHGATRQRMLRELIEGLEALAATRTVVLVLEELQWADPSTRDVLGALMRRRHPSRLLVLATREGPDPLVAELSLRGSARELALRPLDAETAAGAFDLTPVLAELVVRRAGGNPLFIAQLAEHAAATGELDTVPDTLSAAIRARLDDLDADTLAALQAGALAGREFTAELAGAALGRAGTPLHAPGVLEPRGTVTWPDGTRTEAYALAHPLQRDVLLGMLTKARRTELHGRIGNRLEAAFGTDPDAAHEIARHYAAAGQPGPAVRFLRLAAERCFARRAYQEGIERLERALMAADRLPDGPERRRAQVELLSQLGQAHVAVHGWSSASALDCLQRSRRVAEDLEDREPLAGVLLALATLHEMRGEPLSALDAYGEGAQLAELGVEGAELVSCALFHQGAFTRSLEQAERGTALTEAGGHYDTFPATLGDNAIVSCHDWAALSMWFLGRPDEALQRALRALELSREPARAYSAATACAQLASLHACRDDPAETLHWAQATVDVARDRGYDYRVAMGRVLRGWAFAAAGRPDGVEEITCGLDASRATGAHLEDPFYLGLLADAHLRGGAYAAGLEAVEEGLAIAARERARYYDAELHRLRGELQLAAGENAAAERSLRAALDVAREQGACSLELRAALALARAFPGAGNRALLASARQALGEADTADTRAAAALLGGVPTAAPEPHTITVLAWQVDGLDAVAPARLPALVAACHAAAQVVAAREKGQIATEDEAGGLIYFGYPQALDDAAARAVRTGRALAEALRAGVNGERLALCAGIDTGAAVIAPLGTSELALGRTPRTAWRLAATADPGDVLVSDATRARCAGAFAFAPHGGGFRVTGERAQRGAERAPLVGRARELDQLLEGWRQAERGLGQAVLLTGEPGIGKSRLVRELTRLADVPALLELQCADTGTASPLHPFAGHLRAVLADEPGGLEALLGEVGLPVAEATPVLATLLGGPARLDPDTLRRRTLDLVCAYVLAHAREPLLLLVEDVHWADPSTLRTLDALVEAVVEAPVLLVATARTDATIEWPALSHITRLALRPCSRPEAEALLARVAHAPSAAADILDRAAGIPFQLEELGRTPADTLEQALAARLDRLSASARDTAQLGALIGHEFAHDLAAASSELEAGAFDAAVAELVAAEQVRVHGRPPARRYDFRHALLREAAAAEAPATHARIARALERRFPDLVRAAPEILARHLEAAGQPRRAVVYRAEAGRMALRRGAGAEAVEQFRRALAVGELSGELELELQTGLGNALLAARGYASPEAAQAFSRARAAGTPAVYGLWVGAVVRARHEEALALGHELGDTPLIGERAIGWPLLCLGRFEEARAHLDQVPGRDGGPAEHVYGPDPLSAGLAAGAWALWGCDEAEAAEQRAAEAIERARELAHPLTLAHALGSGALLAAFREDPAAARSRAVEAIAIAEEFTLGLWAAWSRYALGAADLAAGEPNRAAATVQAGLLAARAAGAALLEPFALTVLGDAERAAGRTTAANARHEEARAAARRTGEHPWR